MEKPQGHNPRCSRDLGEGSEKGKVKPGESGAGRSRDQKPSGSRGSTEAGGKTAMQEMARDAQREEEAGWSDSGRAGDHHFRNRSLRRADSPALGILCAINTRTDVMTFR